MNVDWAALTPWSALAGGVLIGMAAAIFALVNGRIAGISGLLGSLFQRSRGRRAETLLFLLGLFGAPLLWRALAPLPEVHFQTDAVGLVVAGLLVGIGTRYASGCTSGHGVCGLARLSPRSLMATLCFVLSGFAMVFVLRHLLGTQG